jgi:transcriptional regulator with XRE-family HTH domain
MEMSVDRELVRRLRLDKSWSQEKLAAEAGVSLRTIQRIEADGVASHQSCRAIAAALGIQPAELRPAVPPSPPPPPPVEPQQSVVVASPWRFAMLRTTRLFALTVLWLLMAFLALNAFIVAIGGVFFWEYAEIPDLTAPQAAGGGILTAAVLTLVFLGLRLMYRRVKGARISRAPAAAAQVAVE